MLRQLGFAPLELHLGEFAVLRLGRPPRRSWLASDAVSVGEAWPGG